MSLLRKKPSDSGLVGVQINADGVSLVQVNPPHGPGAESNRPELTVSEWLPELGVPRQAHALADRVEALGLRRRPAHLVLGRDDYQLLLVEAPSVPAGELRDALRWRIRDLIDFPVENAALDTFLLPEDRGRAGRRMAYVAVAHRERIRERVDQMAEAKLDLRVIDIPELALRNLACRLCETERGVALAKVGQGAGSLHIIRGSDLHLARRFNLPYEGGLLEDLPEEVLVLEIQRSLDYFERQMRQPPPGQIVLVGENLTPDKVTEELENGLPMGVSLLDIEDRLELGERAQAHTLSLCLEAIGAAMPLSGEGTG